jgi:hypothetical protein
VAGKKPAKPMAGQAKKVVLDPEIYGVEIRYVGTKDSSCCCPTCKKITVRGMMRLKNDNFYCSLTCAKGS